MPTTATRKAAATKPNPLHDALAAANEAARLAAFTRTTGCDPLEVSADGKSLDILRVFDAMRSRGYQVGQPTKPQAQPMIKRGLIAWTVVIGIAGATAKILFYEPVPQ